MTISTSHFLSLVPKISSFPEDRQHIRYNIVMVAVLAAAYAMLYKWLEHAYFTPQTPMQLSPFFWSSLSFFALVLVAAHFPNHTYYVERTALILSLLTHFVCYPLSFGYALGLHNLQQDAILAIAKWNTVNYMIVFSIFTMRRAILWALFIYLIPLGIWLYFTHIYASYADLGLTPRAFSTLVLTGLINLSLCAILKSMTHIAAEAHMMAGLAVRDSLTGLVNRLYLDDFLHNSFPQRQHQGLITSVAICDIDNFKQVNDNYSHIIGDEVLRHFAKILQENIRSSDIAGRYGGEEFLLVFLDVAAAEAAKICESLRSTVENYDWEDIQAGLYITASFGVSDGTKLAPHDTMTTIVHHADLKMYQAKHQGRNQVCV